MQMHTWQDYLAASICTSAKFPCSTTGLTTSLALKLDGAVSLTGKHWKQALRCHLSYLDIVHVTWWLSLLTNTCALNLISQNTMLDHW